MSGGDDRWKKPKDKGIFTSADIRKAEAVIIKKCRKTFCEGAVQVIVEELNRELGI